MRWPAPRLAGMLAVVGSVLVLLVAPFHTAAYFNTEDGSADLLPWQEAGGDWLREAFPAAFDFTSVDQVYKTYGVVTATALALLGFGFLGFHGLQERRLLGWRRVVGRVACVTWCFLALAAYVEYLTPYTDQAFLVAGPALLLTVILTAVSGFAGATRGAAPAWMARSLAVAALLFIPSLALFGHISMALYAFAVAWLAIGPRLLPTPTSSPKASPATVTPR